MMLVQLKKVDMILFMQKEMHEQPYVIKETLRAHIENNLAMPELSGLDVSKINQIYFVACGTAYHASLYAQYLLRTWIDLPIYCISASEFRYGNYRIDENTLCIFVSQSGETADTLAALKLSKENKAQTLSVTNVLGSSLARLSDYVYILVLDQKLRSQVQKLIQHNLCCWHVYV